MLKTRVLVADQQLVAEGLRLILKEQFEVVGAVSSGSALVSAALKLRPELVILDFTLGEPDGTDACLQVMAKLPGTRVVFLTQRCDRLALGTALRVGARGYILKQQSPTELCEALRRVARGGSYTAPQLQDYLPWARGLRPVTGAGLDSSLTGRQLQVLQLLAEGKTNREIAEHLRISPKTAEFHRAGLMDGLGVRTIAELTRFAIEHRLMAAA